MEKNRTGLEIFGIVLTIILIVFLLFSTLLTVEKKEDSKTIEKEKELKPEKTITNKPKEKKTPVKKETKTKIEMNIKPPIPEDFNESLYKKKVILNDDLAAIFNNLDPIAVRLYDDTKDKISGKDSLKIVQIGDRSYWPLIDYEFPSIQNWSGIEFFSFYFKGNKTGLIFDVYIYFNKRWKDYVVFRFKDIYEGWQRFVFSTKRNIIKSGNVDWSKVWRIRITNNNRKFKGTFYFDEFSIWINETVKNVSKKQNATRIVEKKKKTIYKIRDEIVRGNLAVKLIKFYDRYEIPYQIGRYTYFELYSAVKIRVRNVGEKEIFLKFLPYKPVLIDDKGRTYYYKFVKIRKPYGIWEEHPEQLRLNVLYPNASVEGLIFFEKEIPVDVKNLTLILYLNYNRYEFKFKSY